MSEDMLEDMPERRAWRTTSTWFAWAEIQCRCSQRSVEVKKTIKKKKQKKQKTKKKNETEFSEIIRQKSAQEGGFPPRVRGLKKAQEDGFPSQFDGKRKEKGGLPPPKKNE